MFEKLLQSMLPPGFDINVVIATITQLAQDFADVKTTVMRIEGMLLATPVTIGASPSVPATALTQSLAPVTVAVPTPISNAPIVTIPAAPSDAEVASAKAVLAALAAQPQVTADTIAASEAQNGLKVQDVGQTPTAPIWGQ